MTVKVHPFFHDVFGEQQTVFDVTATLLFAVVGTLVIYHLMPIPLQSWQGWLALLLIADVLAGCVANFTRGTNAFYAARPKNRRIFIAVHVHLLAIAWLLELPWQGVLTVWGYTMVAAALVNALHGSQRQRFCGALLWCVGLVLITVLALPPGVFLVSALFMTKVVYSFAVDHYPDLTAR
ncbi:hypothetical protein LJ739_04995 [Aestuariibacter halophilus]|uniref:Uncharacterized protein n=1 Tax=Fluctibacter halophilus TaxID=226011 RepID=A0ABS8G536_9ALTE|nr:hypothetical protein [Aestuariibacter halophilus]MCC2615593.1 hypothetical protein [Aestuariibacter halophilus]